jgi:hypothetical protein
MLIVKQLSVLKFLYFDERHIAAKASYIQICQINEKYNSLVKNHCSRKIALLSILIKLSSFVTKKKFFDPQPKNPGYGTVSNHSIN